MYYLTYSTIICNLVSLLLSYKVHILPLRSWSSSESDSDFVDTDGEQVTWLDNVVLLTGPSGVGKSGAISTCAKQLGYKVIRQ